MLNDNAPGITHDETAHPMESAAPVIGAIAALGILAVAGFTALEFFYSGAKPVTVAHTTQPAPTPPPAG